MITSNMATSGEGLLLTTLSGSGKVRLQSLPFSRMADLIAAASGVGDEEVGEEHGLLGRLLG